MAAPEFTQCTDENTAYVSLFQCISLGVQTESVQDAAEETDVVTDLSTVSQLQQS